jgi:uncharacterized protein YhbP (UPF0306 family)
MNIEQAIREYLPNVMHLSLATSAHNIPWICELHYAFDDHLNLYFFSRTTARHSLDILDNPLVAGNIIEQHDGHTKVRGVYFEGSAELLPEVDASHIAYRMYNERFQCGPGIIAETNTADGHKFYKISVQNFYLFDNRETDPGQKFTLPWGSGVH